MGAGAAQLGAVVIVLVWFAALSVYDIRQRRLPNALTLPGAVAVLAVALATGRGLPALVGAAALVLVYLAVHVVMPRGLGAGDVKLALGVGALTGSFGVDAWVLAALAAPLLTALWAVIVAVVLRQAAVSNGRPAAVPHGPSMCVSALAAVAIVIG
jgi:leader peptidase (prepilin peptidase)/N-methyltransferase